MRHQLTGKALTATLRDSRVEFCENADEGGLDDGRYFVHLIKGWICDLGLGSTHSFSCGTVKEARHNLRKRIEPCTCARCAN